MIGAAETVDIEFKSEPYTLGTRRADFEFAKDISGMANAGGGSIFIGFRTESQLSSAQDIVAEVLPFAEHMLNAQQYLDKLDSKVYPAIQGVQIEWCETVGGAGVAIIRVPEQSDEDVYFLIQDPVGDEDPTPGYLVGVAVRRASNVLALRIQDLHHLLRQGKTLAPRLAAIEAALAPAPVPQEPAPADELEARIEESLEDS